jgi:serine/threonine protein phosphatase 1
MRVLAVGDIHGCLHAFKTLLDLVAPRPEDLVVTLGDYVDRGPDSRGVLDLLIQLHAGGRLVALRGNHEQLMLDGRADQGRRHLWLACGGRETLDSYRVKFPEASDLKEVPDAHWRFIEDGCVDWYETDTHFFVHANAHPELPLDEQPNYMLLWEPLFEPCDHVSGKVMVCGHTKQSDGLPRDFGTTVCIDTGAYAPAGWLTCLDVAGCRYWQANQRGQMRTGRLEDLKE